jgi:hypothetical protein
LSYTLSNSKDNQFGQPNNYVWRATLPQNNYDLDAEYGTSIYDSPHRIILAPLVNFPSPKDKSGIAYLLGGGWNASTIVELVSGGPLNAVLSAGTSDADLGLFGGRQRPNPRRRPEHDGPPTRIARHPPITPARGFSRRLRTRTRGSACMATHRGRIPMRASSSGRTSTSCWRNRRHLATDRAARSASRF